MSNKILGCIDTFLDGLLKLLGYLTVAFSFEWLLTRTRRPNGGDIILARAILTALWMYMLAIFARNRFTLCGLWGLILETLPWFGAIFAAIYFALYARFASQWTYLANVYNQIKGVEVRAPNSAKARKKIAEWKAGFLEDAEVLHLATHRVFSSVLKVWGNEKLVEAAYCKNTPGGKVRFDLLMRDVEKIDDATAAKYTK